MTSAPPPAAQQPPINTRQAPRRTLRFRSLDDLEAELDRIEQAHAAGALRATGNWTPGQILQHLAIFWAAGIDGFPAEMKPPALLVVAAKLLLKRRATSGVTTPAGFRLPRKARPHLEPPQTSFEDGMAALRAQIARTRAGESFSHPSPLFGKLTHDEWQRLQFGHCQLHLGFLHPAAEGFHSEAPRRKGEEAQN